MLCTGIVLIAMIAAAPQTLEVVDIMPVWAVASKINTIWTLYKPKKSSSPIRHCEERSNLGLHDSLSGSEIASSLAMTTIV